MALDNSSLFIDLEPIDPSQLRSTEGTSVWETVQGKRNRITIGQPRWVNPADALDADTMARLRREYRLDEHDARVMRMSLTLLPDPRCRFRTADLVLTLAGGATFVHLEPREQLSTLYRLALAEYLCSTIVLDDQLVQSDGHRMEWFRALLVEKAQRFQIVVFTCRPADYLDAAAIHPCNGENAYQGFEITMAILRSVAERGQIKLPLGPGEPELDRLGRVLPQQPVILSGPFNRKEYEPR